MEPVRTCLGCRKRADKSSLLRVVVHDGEVVADVSASLPGRGAWVHPTRACVESAHQRRAFARALRAEKALDSRQLLTTVIATTVAPKEQAD